jgi:phosphoglycerate kinase
MSGRYFTKLTVRDVPLDNKTVLLRADYNVPLEEDGTIADDNRIIQSIPTLKYLLEDRGCSVVICSHLGRPDAKNHEKLSLRPIAVRLSELLGRNVELIEDCIGDKVSVATKRLQPGRVVLLENVRFYDEEEKNNTMFARRLARDSHARYFIQDGFGVVHRAHASTSAITQFLPSVGGLLLEREYQHILGAIRHPKRPLTAILGGAKIADKIEVIDEFIKIADRILIGGAMANTFLQYHGYKLGKSLVEPDESKMIEKIYDDIARKVELENVTDFLLLPHDVAVGEHVDVKEPRKEIPASKVHAKEIVLDIGAHTAKKYIRAIGKSGTVIWNGTMGYAESPAFSDGSVHMANHLASHPEIISVVGGGDTADFVLHWDKKKGASFTHVSTGGGASLELMSGKKLPGVEALLKK